MRTVWLLALVAALLFAGMGLLLADLRPGVVALQFAYSPARFQAVLTQWGDAGLRLFRLHLLPDYVMLAAYGAFGFLFARRSPWLQPWSASRRRAMGALLPLAALCDALENTLHADVLGQDLDARALEILGASALAGLKWLLLLAFFSWLAWAALRRPR